MGELDTYAIADFIPFTAEVYDRLFTRHNEAFWPLPLLTLALGFVALWAAWRGRGRLLGALLAAAWAWVGGSFLWQMYATLNWAGEWFAYAFFTQAAILLAMALTGWLDGSGLDPGTRRFGLAIVLYGLLVHPLLAPLAGRPWTGAEVFGHAPEPTAVVTLGLMIIAARTRWLTMPIPLLWCAIAAATASVLGGPLGLVTPVVAVLAVLGATIGWLRR